MILISLLAVVAALRSDETSDLNRAVSFLINEMRADGFYASTFAANAGGATATAFPSSYVCSGALPPLNLIEADSDLARVVTSGVLRVGYAEAAIAAPYITEAPLAGIEIDFARETGRRLGIAYGTAISVQFVKVASGSLPFFDASVAALESRRVDIMWSRFGITAARALLADFTCSNLPSQLVLYGGAGVGAPPSSGFTVGCIGAIFCGQKLPAGGTFSTKQYASVDALIADVDAGGVQYAVGNYEQISFLATTDKCNGCTIFNNLDIVFLAPMTRRLERPSQAALIVPVAATHASSLVARIPFASVRAAKAGYNEAVAARDRYAALCDATQRAKQCTDAVDDAFEHLIKRFEHEFSDSPDAASTSLD